MAFPTYGIAMIFRLFSKILSNKQKFYRSRNSLCIYLNCFILVFLIQKIFTYWLCVISFFLNSLNYFVKHFLYITFGSFVKCTKWRNKTFRFSQKFVRQSRCVGVEKKSVINHLRNRILFGTGSIFWPPNVFSRCYKGFYQTSLCAF